MAKRDYTDEYANDYDTGLEPYAEPTYTATSEDFDGVVEMNGKKYIELPTPKKNDPHASLLTDAKRLAAYGKSKIDDIMKQACANGSIALIEKYKRENAGK